MRIKEANIMWILIATSIILGVLAVVRSFHNDASLYMDYMGVIVGMLALLVTVLIGWQIYIVINKNIEIEIIPFII